MNRTAYDVQSLTKELKVIPVTVTILGNTTPANGTFTITQGDEAVGTLTRVSTGLYEMRLKDSFPKLMSAHPSIHPHNGAARTVRMDAIDVVNATAASRTIRFAIINTSLAVVDTPNGETDRVYLTLFAKNSGAK